MRNLPSMRLGPIQRNILMFLYRCPETGGFIGSTTACSELAGYDLPQVKKALAALVRRELVRQEGSLPRSILSTSARNWCWYQQNHAPKKA